MFSTKISKYLGKLFNTLNNKKIHYVMLFLFIILLGLYIWSLYEPNLFYRNFHGKHRLFHIYHLSNKILYGLIIISITIISQMIIFFTNKGNNLKTSIKNNIIKHFNKYIFVYIVYIIIIYIITVISLKIRILLILTPIIFYLVYNVYNHIQETKENYKKWFLFDSRYLFLTTLVLLIYTPIFIYFEDKQIAEQLSIYAYYGLVLGVINEIITSKFNK